MATSEPDASELLCREILADGRGRADEVLQQARDRARELLAAADVEAAQARGQLLDRARDDAARRREATLATVPVEAGRMRSAAVEVLLESLHVQARARLAARDGFDPDVTRVALAAEAVARMDGESFVATVAAGGRLDVDEVRRRAGRPAIQITVREDPAQADAGVVVEDADGRQAWDNRLGARLERLWPELRRRLVARVAGGP